MQTKHLCVLIHIRINGEVQVQLKMLKTTNIFLLSILRWCIFWGILFLLFMCYICLYYVVLSIHCNIMITCCERADLLVHLCVVFSYAFVTFPYGVPGHVWNLIVLITNLWLPLCFNKLDDYNKVYEDVSVWMLNKTVCFKSTQ